MTHWELKSHPKRTVLLSSFLGPTAPSASFSSSLCFFAKWWSSSSRLSASPAGGTGECLWFVTNFLLVHAAHVFLNLMMAKMPQFLASLMYLSRFPGERWFLHESLTLSAALVSQLPAASLSAAVSVSFCCFLFLLLSPLPLFCYSRSLQMKPLRIYKETWKNDNKPII